MTTNSENGPSPRAFANATGFVYQVVGFVLVMGACCWWSFSGLIQDELRTKSGHVFVNIPQDASLGQIFAMLAACILVVGGLAIIALGIGLQYDRLRTGGIAKWLTGGIALFFGVWLGYSLWKSREAGAMTSSAIMLLLWTVLFLLAGVSAEQLRAFPPKREDQRWTPADEDDLRKATSPRPPDKTNP